jgi:hypothetical protein
MQKWIIFVATLAVVASACGGEDSAGTATSTEPAEMSASAPAVDATEPTPEVEGPSAPDFSLTLADGSEFMLSAEQKPVYLIFWAEW